MAEESRMFARSSWVWVPDEELMLVPAQVLAPFQRGQPGVVQFEGQSEQSVLTPEVSSRCRELDEQSLGELEDMVQVSTLKPTDRSIESTHSLGSGPAP
jgi:hypothetical protein